MTTIDIIASMYMIATISMFFICGLVAKEELENKNDS